MGADFDVINLIYYYYGVTRSYIVAEQNCSHPGGPVVSSVSRGMQMYWCTGVDIAQTLCEVNSTHR
jgi:hypothetical protein